MTTRLKPHPSDEIRIRFAELTRRLAEAGERIATQALRNLTRRLEEANEAIRKLAWRECPDCDGDGHLGKYSDGRKQACESCGGHEDSPGDGWLPNHDDIGETMRSPAVRRALGIEEEE